MESLTGQMILVLCVIGAAVFLFIVEWVRVDVVAMGVMVSLPLLGLVSPTEAFTGFSSNAVISIIAVIIMGAGLDRTGVVGRVAEPVSRMAGKSPGRIIAVLSATLALISSFMQSIGAAALFLPAISRISKKSGAPMGRLLMPVGFSALLGGTVTLVASSPMIMLNDLIEPFGLQPFGLFSPTPIGLALVCAGIGCFVLFGRYLLPGAEPDGEAEQESSSDVFELVAPPEYGGENTVRVQDLKERYQVNVVGITEPPDYKRISPDPGTRVHPGADLVVHGGQLAVLDMARQEGMAIKENREVFSGDLGEHASGTVEAVVGPQSDYEGTCLSILDLEEVYHVTPVALISEGKTFVDDLEDKPLSPGDAVVLHGAWKNMMRLRQDRDFIFVTPLDVDALRPDKALWSGFWLVLALTMAVGFDVRLSIALMTGALGMVLTGVLSIDEAYKAVSWRTVFLLAGLIPLGLAAHQTGAAAWMARGILGFLGQVPPLALYAVVALLATGFTLVMSNVGATVLLVPLAVNLAMASGADPRAAALVVGIAVSNSFILPTHQVNALYMGPGHYHTKDYLKAGGALSLVFLMVLLLMVWIMF